MSFFVYIIQSQLDNSFYKGYSENYLERLKQHNDGWSNYTSRKIPWNLVYVESCLSKKDALIREKAIKKYSHAQIKQLICSTKNILHL